MRRVSGIERFTMILSARRRVMPKCGVCGWNFSDRTLTKHAETACGMEEEKADRVAYSPEIDDLIKIEEESNGI
jgi:hypothetical protein